MCTEDPNKPEASDANDEHSTTATTAGRLLLALALVANCVITYPLSVMLLITMPERLEEVYGPDTEARRILGCMYLAIALVSTLALLAWAARRNIQRALQLAVPLFMVQILYKVATAFAVGLQDKNPVVIANLGVVGLQLVTIGLNWKPVAKLFL